MRQVIYVFDQVQHARARQVVTFVATCGQERARALGHDVSRGPGIRGRKSSVQTYVPHAIIIYRHRYAHR